MKVFKILRIFKILKDELFAILKSGEWLPPHLQTHIDYGDPIKLLDFNDYRHPWVAGDPVLGQAWQMIKIEGICG